MSSQYKILIAEDDALIAQNLKFLLEDLGHQVVGIANSKEKAIDLLQKKPDFAILDIRMYGKDIGFEIAAYIKAHKAIPFIFLTSFSDSQTVKKASIYEPSGYLVKPFKKVDIFTTLEIAMAKTALNSPSIQIKDGHTTLKIATKDILWAKSDNIYVEIKTISKLYVVRDKLDNILAALPSNFIRCHRSFVVNQTYITSFSAKELIIANTSIPVSRTYRQNVKDIFSK